MSGFVLRLNCLCAFCLADGWVGLVVEDLYGDVLIVVVVWCWGYGCWCVWVN